MEVSSARTEMLARYSALDASLVEGERNLHTEDVEVFLEVIYEEATEDGRLAYDREIDQTDPTEYPWSAVRAREVFDSDGILETLGAMLTYSPPALTLILARRADLEPEAPGDELPAEGSGILESFGNWDPTTVLDSISPFGWSEDPTADVQDTLDDIDALGEAFEDLAEDLEEQPQVQPDPVPVPAPTPAPTPTSPTPAPTNASPPSSGLSTNMKIGLGVGTFALVGLGVWLSASTPAPKLPVTGAEA